MIGTAAGSQAAPGLTFGLRAKDGRARWAGELMQSYAPPGRFRPRPRHPKPPISLPVAVVLFEDAHWIDPTSRELLDLTAEAEKRSCVVGSLDRSLGAYARAAAFDPSAVMGSAAEELMVCRLFAGGRWIRTIGTA